ncbi:hypothetical protein DOTSEDRAFT_78999 [Dothistroma septosporum NZE10]|uniref:RNB domain-containing protein n=1 Tax=Dothistroma septosporum (strain NZE10 / CBS 128990) TaxID=675120 RepID=N1PXE0_DOTSN|nr:hypothetical protein DOTSEDRAFT_78999 [Dothistroma septosporum NZE10]
MPSLAASLLFPMVYLLTNSTYPTLLPFIRLTASCNIPNANPAFAPIFAVLAAVGNGKRFHAENIPAVPSPANILLAQSLFPATLASSLPSLPSKRSSFTTSPAVAILMRSPVLNSPSRKTLLHILTPAALPRSTPSSNTKYTPTHTANFPACLNPSTIPPSIMLYQPVWVDGRRCAFSAWKRRPLSLLPFAMPRRKPVREPIADANGRRRPNGRERRSFRVRSEVAEAALIAVGEARPPIVEGVGVAMAECYWNSIVGRECSGETCDVGRFSSSLSFDFCWRMLALRDTAVGKSTKEAYVCLSCRLKTQRRRYGETKARFEEANVKGQLGADETTITTFLRELLSERLHKTDGARARFAGRAANSGGQPWKTSTTDDNESCSPGTQYVSDDGERRSTHQENRDSPVRTHLAKARESLSRKHIYVPEACGPLFHKQPSFPNSLQHFRRPRTLLAKKSADTWNPFLSYDGPVETGHSASPKQGSVVAGNDHASHAAQGHQGGRKLRIRLSASSDTLPKAEQKLEKAIDQHLRAPTPTTSHDTLGVTTSSDVAHPPSLRSPPSEDARNSTHATGGSGNAPVRAVPMAHNAVGGYKAFESLDDATKSTGATQARCAERTSDSYSQNKSVRLKNTTAPALDAREDAASIAAVENDKGTGTQAATGRQPASTTTRFTPLTFNPHTPGDFAWQGSRPPVPPARSRYPRGVSARLYHSTVRASQQPAVSLVENHTTHENPVIRYTTGEEPYYKAPSTDEAENPNGIRAQLRKWQELHGHEDSMPEVVDQDDYADMDTPVNNFTRLPVDSAARRQMQAEEDEKAAFAQFANAGKEGYDGSSDDSARFLKMGDLVEIEYLMSERESMLAVYVQPVHSGMKEAQFFTMQGRWVHTPVKCIVYSIPGWVSPESVKPLLEHLPSPEETLDMDALLEKAYTEDLSVPREVAAPLVNRMVEFHNESQEIYRKHASTLDDAHNILAHDTDLRYGSLVSAATTLLRTPSDKLPLTALFTVRKALTHGGFAFSIDRRSHRLTGYMQIRSKEQVKMVDHVRHWIRQWQDDLAQTAGMNQRQLSGHRVAKGAQHVYGFLQKAKTIVLKNRETRHPMPVSTFRPSCNVGISKTRLPITETSDCIRIQHGTEFTADETEIVRFMESWACSQMFIGLPRIESLPPLLLQATGLYDNCQLAPGTGFVFLQEMGTIMPYENRIRFDPHLLLPSSQHSKPLQNLMNSLMSMKNDHHFSDSMADLRRDWKDLPVYCIDDAGAHEIDDGISIESAGKGTDGKEQYWVHIHIANPTAFFSRDHPLAKMARHMGETIYMPERTYMMLPRWATQQHFSLGPDRPALTFSAKLDQDANTLDQKITPGILRNVMRLTPKDVQRLVSDNDAAEDTPELIVTVGGDPPPSKAKSSRVPDATTRHINDMRLLQNLAAKRADLRKSNGGVFFDSHKPDVKVWQTWKNQGLAWDHPYRRGSRIVEGDPVIQMRTTGLRNWFAPSYNVVDILVRECMLLACETAASWCSERRIPVIYRGTIADPLLDSRKVWEETMLPSMREDGSFPMHVGVQYMKTLGVTVLRTGPKRHAFLGMDHYSKVTSPLRRYGDMILHWQIEAALRHEAQTGESLINSANNRNPNRSFLPFSKSVLDTIMLGLQPRESIISRSKSKAEDFWTCMLLFRKHHFGEDGGLPYKTFRVFIATDPGLLQQGSSASFCVELGTNMTVYDPRKYGLPEAKQGDVWEVELDCVDVYLRGTFVKPLRLVGREGAGIV